MKAASARALRTLSPRRRVRVLQAGRVFSFQSSGNIGRAGSAALIWFTKNPAHGRDFRYLSAI
jgi:hypothetical protein